MDLENEGTEVEDGVADSSVITDSTIEETQNRKPDEPKVRLEEFEEFKKYQSEFDRAKQELMNQAEAAKAEANRLKEELDSARMEKMSDEERLRYELGQTKAQLSQYQRTSEQQILEAQREQQLQAIVAQTGVPREAIESANSPSEAWQIGLAYFKDEKGKREKREERDRRASDNNTDIGGGSPTPSKGVKAKVDDAISNGDMAAIYAAHTGSD